MPATKQVKTYINSRVFGLLERLTEGTGLGPLDVFATNMAFVETSNTQKLKVEFGHLMPTFWKIHQRFLREVKPDYVICLGYGDRYSAFSLMHERSSDPKEINPPHTGKPAPPLKWFRGNYRLDDGTPLQPIVAGVYHPSYRPIPTSLRGLLEEIPKRS